MASKINIIKAAAVLFGATMAVSAAQADTFSFTIENGPASYFYDRTPIDGGIVTGVLYGLTDNGWSKPTAVSITYADPGLGLASGPLTSSWQWGGTGFQETNGQITDANFDFNFNDAAGNGFQLRLNDQVEIAGANWLFWNGGSQPVTGVGNTLGFSGAQYQSMSSGVPEPSTWALMMIGFVGLGFASYRRNKMASVAA
ncbi:PEP-CTERM sorting domain-containing protein [uncultured Rhodoblastus sp.]|uniref:PEP-CTERM sorting domain-containing protein n=1 Tax=uncultured Rhodoblastus sp. TaxID=543037 RepID=UPI0025EE00FF|nr:PEP-CTERM sorting domain-containing protein [uncultured Rhodoblastus sp.]